MTLSVAKVGLSYDNRPVLKDISFDLDPQETALLLGPSGSGKSSLLNIVCGLQAPDAGTVSLGDQRVVSAGRSDSGDAVRREHMGIVFQTLRLVSALSVRDNLLLAQKLQTGSKDRAAVDAIMARIGIAHRAHARPFDLSQGEAQRAAIARALVVRPTLLIADEPTSALDNINTQIVAELLVEAARDAGAALLVATHDDRLKSYFQRTLTLGDGRIAA